MNIIIESRFPLGQIVATRGVANYCDENKISLLPFLVRHSICDWGDICDDDKEVNAEALEHGMRLMSVYYLPDKMKTKVWIITEADRSVTTVLFPEEY